MKNKNQQRLHKEYFNYYKAANAKCIMEMERYNKEMNRYILEAQNNSESVVYLSSELFKGIEQIKSTIKLIGKYDSHKNLKQEDVNKMKLISDYIIKEVENFVNTNLAIMMSKVV